MKRLGLALMAMISLLSVVVGTGEVASAAVDGDDFRGEELAVDLRWVPCHPEAGPGFECARARVPLDYDRPNGGKTVIELVKQPATGEPRGSLFLNPGGPGGSGIDAVLNGIGFAFAPEVTENYDLIGFDPRGIIRSSPVLCFGTFNAALSSGAPFPFPVGNQEIEIQRKANSFLQTQCRNRAGIMLNKVSTGNVARDLEVLRASVGDEGLNFLGLSYGSVIGQVYANMFPDRVGHIIIDGVLAIEDWVGGPSINGPTTLEQRIRSSQGAEETFAEFLAQCDANADRCALAPFAPLRAEGVLATLAEGPLEIVDPDTGELLFRLTYAELVGTTLGALYAPQIWELLANLYAEVEFLIFLTQSASPDIAQFDQARGLQLEMTALQRALPKYPNVAEGFPAVACVDTAHPKRFRDWVESSELMAQDAPIFGPLWNWSSSVCNRWPGKDADRFVGPFSQETSAPLLVMTTRYDPATSFQQGVKAAAALPGSSLVIVDGWGHTTLGTSSCGAAITAAYLLDDTLPPSGTVCDADLAVPFTELPEPMLMARQALLQAQG